MHGHIGTSMAVLRLPLLKLLRHLAGFCNMSMDPPFRVIRVAIKCIDNGLRIEKTFSSKRDYYKFL